MPYPTIEQYQTALQHPSTAFTDPQLASGKIRSSNLGLPLVASGGFALTYALEAAGKKLAVRCFHREAKGIERRYAAISLKLSALASNYFVKFEFQPTGFKLNKAVYPLVKMAWAEGETLGQFVESNYQDKTKLYNLIGALSQLAAYLESQGIAHGDIQEGNLMVADEGRKVQLIDYDGMYVPEIAALGGSELGHRDYQHPKRTASEFNSKLDRFSFIVLDLSLKALCIKPVLWNQSQSGAGVIVCRANDFAAPTQSKILAEMATIPGLEQNVKNFVAICSSGYSATPSLSDFVANLNIPAVSANLTVLPAALLSYISQYPVLNAGDFALFHKHIGSMVELVGKIVEVSDKRTKHGRPYVFINFAPWKGKAVKIAIWSTALQGEKSPPTQAWVGRWVTIRGLVEPVYSSSRYGYEHITITATAVNQISHLTEQEATYRLTPARTRINSTATATVVNNVTALSKLQATRSASPPVNQPTAAAPPAPTLSANQAALQRMRQPTSAPVTPTSNAAPPQQAHVQVNRPTARNAPVTAQSRHSQNVPKQSGFVAWLKNFFS
jgi:predicted Ser/Thr protein kinase